MKRVFASFSVLALLTTFFACGSSVNFIPTSGDVPGSQVWYDSSDSLVDDGTGKISQWTDKGSNGINCTQGTSGNRMSIATGVLNGKSVASSQSSGKVLDCGSNDLWDKNSAYTIAIVEYMNTTDLGGCPGVFLASDAGVGANWVLYYCGGWGMGTGSWALTGWESAMALGAWRELMFTYNGSGRNTTANYGGWVNSASQTLGGSSNTPPTNRSRISNDGINNMRGYIAEIKVWPFEFSSAQRTQRFNYRAAQWGF